jgi:hypothetical protein
MVKNLHIENKDLENDDNLTDNENDISTEELDEPVPLVKEKKPRSAKQIEAFKLAQQKRQENIKQIRLSKEIKTLDKKENNVINKHHEIIKKKKELIPETKPISKPKQKPVVVEESESEDEEVVVITKRKKPKVKKIIIEESDTEDDESEEEEPTPIKDIKQRHLRTQQNKKSVIQINNKPKSENNKSLKVDLNDWFL